MVIMIKSNNHRLPSNQRRRIRNRNIDYNLEQVHNNQSYVLSRAEPSSKACVQNISGYCSLSGDTHSDPVPLGVSADAGRS
ncbi:hypothetical protein PNOK_0676600 [Pyrrhoderma noxium]|uniref:Uncharacterized protein n=1 Tax=Pyrrhoderma noxium TaxID=2282107 RepID=A0A286UFB1_9AGAM|nr:hypothetical protein PNOK_0676600 [Pyrrhoderma noxium]